MTITEKNNEQKTTKIMWKQFVLLKQSSTYFSLVILHSLERVKITSRQTKLWGFLCA